MSQRLSSIKSGFLSKQKSRLQLARQKVKLNPQQLRNFLFGQGNFDNYVKPTLKHIEDNKHIFTHQNLQSQTLEQQRKQAARMMISLKKFWNLDIAKQPNSLIYICYATGMFDGGLCTKSILHYFLYSKALLVYKNNKIHQQIYKKAVSGQDIGCFGLTEFHHGSYSKGVQTIATYDHATKQFFLATQGTKGMKFWIGALSELANVAIIWAQLIIDGRSEGPHPFYVPIRCKKTHKTLQGIVIGDCGLKRGLDYIDNGFIIMDNVKVPRQHLLGKFGSVDSEGKYYSPIKNRELRFGLHMSALSAGRGLLSIVTNVTAVNASTIALRYAHSRKQFQNNDKSDEIHIIDYPLTQHRLIPQIASSVIQIPVGNELALAYYGNNPLFQDGQYVNQMHAISASVKARFTWNSMVTAQECRTILGGHGYSSLSRIPSIVDNIDVNVTWQGANHVLLQQTTKFLIKTLNDRSKTKIVDLAFVYSQQSPNLQSLEQKLMDLNSLEVMLKDLLRLKYRFAKEKTSELKAIFTNKEDADYNFHPEAGKQLSLTFADYYTFTVFRDKLYKTKDSELRAVLQKYLFLWVFGLLEKERYGTHDLRKALQKEIINLQAELVEASVAVTDAIAPSSFVIGSPFANFNGEGFKEYLQILQTKEHTFQRSHYFHFLVKTITSQ